MEWLFTVGLSAFDLFQMAFEVTKAFLRTKKFAFGIISIGMRKGASIRYLPLYLVFIIQFAR